MNPLSQLQEFLLKDGALTLISALRYLIVLLLDSVRAVLDIARYH